jgi:hypothetical protein
VGNDDTADSQQTGTDAGDQQTSRAAPSPEWRQEAPSSASPPWEALNKFDRQWEDPTALVLRRHIEAIALVPANDPRRWDYLTAISGDSEDETAAVRLAWLEAQVAADAVSLGRITRPRVMLVPAARMWHVIREVGDLVVSIDGPGWPTPYAAVQAATRRYHAELLRVLAGGDDGVDRDSAGEVDADPDDGDPNVPEPTDAAE